MTDHAAGQSQAKPKPAKKGPAPDPMGVAVTTGPTRLNRSRKDALLMSLGQLKGLAKRVDHTTGNTIEVIPASVLEPLESLLA
jgi:hypothetical protein